MLIMQLVQNFCLIAEMILNRFTDRDQNHVFFPLNNSLLGWVKDASTCDLEKRDGLKKTYHILNYVNLGYPC